MATATFQDRVIEFFTLRETSRELAAVPDEVRTSVFRGLRIAFQRREAAETLWPRGSTAEALKLAVGALEGATAALSAFPTDPPRPWLARARDVASDASKYLADARLPTLEEETGRGHEEIFRGIVESLIAIEDLVGMTLAAQSDLRSIRNARIAAAAFGISLGIAALVYVLHTPTFSKATASGQSAENAPEKAIDGDTGTSWILPDHVGQGWLDVQLTKPRSVHVIHILASNPPYNDRDVKDAHVDAMLGSAIVKSVDVTLPEPIGKEASWNDIVLDAPKCDHLHITLKSNYKLGLGISELELK